VFLCDQFKRTRPIDLECGALYHAAHGLQLYRARRFGPRPEMLPKEEEKSIFSDSKEAAVKEENPKVESPEKKEPEKKEEAEKKPEVEEK
jgi:hypothetical protein